MFITISGYRSQNKFLCSLLENAAEFYAGLMMRKDLVKNIDLDIIIVKRLKKKEKCYGYCYLGDTQNWRPREFKIEMDGSVSLKLMLATLAHEMVHLKQWARRQMQDYEDHRAPRRWKSQSIRVTGKGRLTYRKLPWEKEAYKWEKRLVNEFKKTGDYNKLAWKIEDVKNI